MQVMDILKGRDQLLEAFLCYQKHRSRTIIAIAAISLQPLQSEHGTGLSDIFPFGCTGDLWQPLLKQSHKQSS
jgi:hypothetical protein